MVYYPQEMINLYNNAITCIYILAGLLTFIVALAFCSSICPEPFEKLKKTIRKWLGLEKVVKTVYSDKTKNYSETEFLPKPSKAPTESFSYEFLGWNKFAKDEKGNFVTEPIFLKTAKTCIVNVYDEKDNLLETHEVQYGAGVTIRHKKIIKEASKEFEYEFIGWDKDTKAFYENTEIRPVFKANPIKYSYKFVMDDGKTVVLEKKAISGTPIICPTDPVKIDDEFVYEFIEWKGYRRDMVLNKDYVFEAVFDKKEAKSKEEKLYKQKRAIEVVLNDYKTKKSSKEEDFKLQDNQEFKSTKVSVEKNKAKTAKTTTEKKAEKNNSLLKGVVVEKNKKK